MAEICSRVKAFTGFSWLTMMAMASRAITYSTGEMPFASASAISSSLIRRDALAMSTVPLMSEAMPVPEPPPVTEIRTAG